MKRTILFIAFGFVLLFSQRPQFIKELNAIKIPKKHYEALNKFQQDHNKKYNNLNDSAAWDTRIHYIKDKCYHFQDKYFIPIVSRGTNFAVTRILYWTGSKYQDYELDGFALRSLSQIQDLPILIAEYDAGCCDARYIAKGVFLFSNDTLKHIILLPTYAHSEPGSSPTVYSPDLKFILQSRVVCKTETNGNTALIFKYWFTDPDKSPNTTKHVSYFSNILNMFEKKMELTIRLNASNLQFVDLSVNGDVQKDFSDVLKFKTKDLTKFNSSNILKVFKGWMMQ